MKTYRFKYTLDNRIKSVQETDGQKESNAAAWMVIALGILACIGVMLLW